MVENWLRLDDGQFEREVESYISVAIDTTLVTLYHLSIRLLYTQPSHNSRLDRINAYCRYETRQRREADALPHTTAPIPPLMATPGPDEPEITETTEVDVPIQEQPITTHASWPGIEHISFAGSTLAGEPGPRIEWPSPIERFSERIRRNRMPDPHQLHTVFNGQKVVLQLSLMPERQGIQLSCATERNTFRRKLLYIYFRSGGLAFLRARHHFDDCPFGLKIANCDTGEQVIFERKE
jgi:hypothetical protein